MEMNNVNTMVKSTSCCGSQEKMIENSKSLDLKFCHETIDLAYSWKYTKPIWSNSEGST